LFEGVSAEGAEGPSAPFNLLAKRWHDENLRTSDSTRSHQFYALRVLTLYFDDTPVGEIDVTRALAFRDDFLNRNGRRGLLAQSTVNQVVGFLRAMCDYAEARGWLGRNPLPAAAPLTFKAAPLKSDRIVTADEEGKLLAACIGKLADLRAQVVCMADTGMYERARRALKWGDVDLERGMIHVRERSVEMTPRLRDELRVLATSAARDPQSLVWERECMSDFLEARAAAGLEGLVLSDFRRTFITRMLLAGRSLEQIAALLGVSDLNRLRRLYQVNPDIAAQERSSPSFTRLMREQFGVSSNGNGQKNGQDISSGRPSVALKRTAEVIDAIAAKWETMKGGGLAYEAQLASMTQGSLWPYHKELKDICEKYGYPEVNKKLNDWFSACRLKEIFPDAPRPFKPFLKTVVAQLKGGIAKEKFSSDLEARRQTGRKAPRVRKAA
jgi:integrase